MEKEIYIIRHGETDFNKMGIIQGRGVDSLLNEKGKEQAKAFFEHFGHIKFEAIFTSSLKRTQETVLPFVEAGYEFEIVDDLDEMHWGIHEGKTAGTELSKEYMEIVSQWQKGILDVKIPGGESPQELQQRQRRFIAAIKKMDYKKILICSHGRAMRSLLCTMLEMDLSRMDDFPHQNLSLYKMRYKPEIFTIELFNHIEHVANL